MRYATDITIDQVIVHMIDPDRHQNPTLSQRTLPLGANNRLAEYFIEHIESSLRDHMAKAARFTALDAGLASQICRDLFNGSMDLVPASQHLATHLRDIMTKDGRISGGDLAICLYRAANKPDVPYYLALLKIDSSQVLRPKAVQDDQGNVYVDLDVVEDVLPTARERLQKCAFIQPLDPRLSYDMMLLDRQAGPGKADHVARFFIDDFMGAAFALDARRRTDILYRSLVSAQNELREDHRITPAQDETLRSAIEQAVVSTSVNVDTIIASLPLPAPEQERIDQIVSDQLPDREFDIDPAFMQRLTAKRRFRGDHGLRVTVATEKYDQIVRSARWVDDGSEPGHYEIVIHTTKWEEVPR